VQAAAKPAAAEINHVVTLFQQGRYEETKVIARRLTELYPHNGFGWKVLGVIARIQGRHDESLEFIEKAAALLPGDGGVHNTLGNIRKDLGDLQEAERCYRRALELMPDFTEAHNNLGITLMELGRLAEAVNSYRRAVEILPDYAEAHNNCGVTLKDLGRLQEAEAFCLRALAIKPDFAEAYNNLGNILKDLGRLHEAEASYRRALELKPGYVKAESNLGSALKDLGRLQEAEACYLRALELKPDFAEALSNLGVILAEQGRLSEAESCYHRALAIKPTYLEAQGNLLFLLTNVASCQPADYFAEASRYGRMAASKAGKRFTSWQVEAEPQRLRVGLVSGDFRNHPVGYFLENVVKQIEPYRIELIAYPTQYKADELSERIRPYFNGWKSLAGLNDEAAASRIHGDGVHLLVDLSGYTAHNRLPVFAWKPAPVQATWLGFLATTGVAEIDYLLGDPQATPAEHEGHFAESVWRMPEVWSCFTPPAFEVTVGPLPALANGCITFGSFNNIAKTNDNVVSLWAKVLQAVPASRLFLKTKQLNDATVCAAIRQRFLAHGVSVDRLLLEGSSQREQMLQTYNRVDIGLDPFPYGGATTTCEALWMGVPVITKKGDRFLSRCGQSINANAGLNDWIAEDDAGYVAKAVAHTRDLKQLAALRDGLRRQVLASPLYDAPRFARNLADAFWGMWRSKGEKGSF
jgi:predicted O-linked N-acetylglucosamine transferase (SPINDLY family)